MEATWNSPALAVRLRTACYEAFDFGRGEDLAAWDARQKGLDFKGDDVDGIPGPITRNALAEAGHQDGLWVSRPGDLAKA